MSLLMQRLMPPNRSRLIVIMSLGIWFGGCTPIAPSATITPAACQAGGEFAWIAPGLVVRGSDAAERNYAYQISAIAAQDQATPAAKVEADLRQSGWFDREPAKTQSDRPGVCLRRNLITNQDYQKFVQATGWRSPGISAEDYQRQGFLVHPYATVRSFLWQGQQFPAGQAQYPVVLVSYEDAVAFAQWRGTQDGATYRLPTTAEWEQAARRPDGRYFPWGNDWRNDGTNWAQDGQNDRTSAVGTYPLSRTVDGVEDMAGNVFEYTSTLVPQGLGQTSVMKGCSWDDLPGFCRAAYEHQRPIGSRHILFGFRLVKLGKPQG
jgi:toxoflavin biosynthesis protein ToxD